MQTYNSFLTRHLKNTPYSSSVTQTTKVRNKATNRITASFQLGVGNEGMAN